VLLNALRALGALLLCVSRRRAAVPIALWTALIWGLSSLSTRGIGTLGRITFLGNLGHAPLFGLLALWFALALPREATAPRRARAPRGGWPRADRAGRARVLAAVALWGFGDELHQHLAGLGRDFSLFDLATDLVGAAATLAIVEYAGRDGASERGLWGRLALGALACVAAAALATWGPAGLPGAAWL
jgi:hypothetical protein